MTTKPGTVDTPPDSESPEGASNESRIDELMALPGAAHCDEFVSAFDTHCDIDRLNEDIARWQRLEQNAQTPSDAIAVRHELGDLRAERARLLALVEPKRTDSKIDLGMLATREQLIEAFGRYSGMNKSWFDNLKDAPRLAAARKVAGRGGRGRIAEPWFCPLEVMLWLIDPKRRKGLTLGEEKGWELLERYFPKVYAANSVGDPRQV